MNLRVPPPEEVASLIGSHVDDYSWRATERNLGSIEAIKGNLTIFATDGNLGGFCDSSGKLFLGHIQNFSGLIRTARQGRAVKA